MPLHVIGGVERQIEQVRSYAEYNDTSEMTPAEIFDNSRANRLYLKELEKTVGAKMAAFYGGADYIELPVVEFVNLNKIPGEFIGGSAVETADNIEQFYAEQAKQLY